MLRARQAVLDGGQDDGQIAPEPSSHIEPQTSCAAEQPCSSGSGRSYCPARKPIHRLIESAPHDVVGVDNMMWGSDYPHSESAFPKSREILEQILAGVPTDERTKIVGGNTARLYHFDVQRMAQT